MALNDDEGLQPLDLVGHGPVIPVIVIDRLEDAVPLAEALVAGGVRVLEVTLRTTVALRCMEAIAKSVPDAIVGAGTVRSVTDAQAAKNAGCRFAAEPAGLFGWVDTAVDTDALSQRMLDEGYLLAPGALFHAERTPSTLMRINFATTQDAAFWKKYVELVKRM